MPISLTSQPRYTVRAARPDDIAGIITIKDALNIGRFVTDNTREGFLLGSSPDAYSQMIAHGVGFVIEDLMTKSIKGFGFALPWHLLKDTEVWQKRSLVNWQSPVIKEIEGGMPGYIEQLAVLPGLTIRFLAPGLGLALVEKLFELGHTHILATTVLKPIRNMAALKLLRLIKAEVVGEIEETYEGVGKILSQVHCASREHYRILRTSPTWRSRTLNYLEKTSKERQVCSVRD